MMFFSNISSPGVPLAWSSVWTTLSNLAFSSAGTEYLWEDQANTETSASLDFTTLARTVHTEVIYLLFPNGFLIVS